MLFVDVEGEVSAASMVKDSKIYVEIAKFVQAYEAIVYDPNKFLADINERPIDEETEVSEASDLMGYMQVRRLVAINKDNKISGVLSVSDLLRNPLTEDLALETMIEISYAFPTKIVEIDNILQTNVFIL